MADHDDDRVTALAAAAAITSNDTGAAPLSQAEEGLRLAWATFGAVRSSTAAGELWWLRLAEAVADAADEVDLVPGTLGVRLGTAPVLTPDIPDTPQLRAAVHELLTAVHAVLRSLAARSSDGRQKLAATLAAAAVARAAETSQ
jgi:hypothetical protein